MIINCLLPGVLEMGVVLVGVVYVPTFHFKKLATMKMIHHQCHGYSASHNFRMQTYCTKVMAMSI